MGQDTTVRSHFFEDSPRSTLPYGVVALARRLEGSAHVPFACRGPPHLVRGGRRLTQPVATMDLAATWLELAGLSTDAAGMTGVTSRSLAGLIKGTSDTGPRDYVSSGLLNWRMVVQRRNATRNGALLKYVCCHGACTDPFGPKTRWTESLFEVGAGGDWKEMSNLLRDEDRAKWLSTAADLRVLLPPAFASGCRSAHAE